MKAEWLIMLGDDYLLFLAREGFVAESFSIALAGLFQIFAFLNL
jgi:hypothetical protein